MEVEDLTSVEWRDTGWLEHFGGFQNRQMVLDYFAMSPFWDRQSNNQVLAMQTQFNDLGQAESTETALRKMTGIEFAVVHEQPPVYVIQKQYRRGPSNNDVTPIATYYITGANIYQSPTVYSVIANRLLTSLFHVNSAFQDAQSMMEYFPAKGYGWKSPSTASNLQKQNRSGKGASSQAYLKAQETQEFRVWMEKAIDTSAMRISQKEAASQTTDSGLATGGKVMDKQGSQLSSQTTQSDLVGTKRQRRKQEDTASKKKKKTTK
ncbi:unnamed protein product [Umbelopsis sp. WA50703]